MNIRISHQLRALCAALLAIATFAVPSNCFAQGGGGTPDPRPFALFRDMFDTFGEWHGPIVNMAYQPQVQYTYSDTPGNKNNFNGTISWGSYIWVTPEINVNINLSLEQIDAPTKEDQWFFNGEGINAGDIWVQWSDQRTGILAGRFTAPFGIAPLLLPGLFDLNSVGAYNFGGLMGTMGTLSTGDEGGGIHSFSVAGFGIDTTFMSQSYIVSTPSPTGPGTGGGVDSFCLAYDGVNIPLLFPTLQVAVSYIDFGTGIGADANQKGLAAGFNWQYVVNGDPTQTLDAGYISVGPMFEYVKFWNVDGVQDASSDFYTLGIIGNAGNWQSDVALTWNNTSATSGTPSYDNFLASASLGYNFFGPQSLVEFGYAYQVQDGKIDNQVGVQVSFPINALEYFPLWN